MIPFSSSVCGQLLDQQKPPTAFEYQLLLNAHQGKELVQVYRDPWKRREEPSEQQSPAYR